MSTPGSAISFALPSATARPPTVPVMPFPGRRGEAGRLLGGEVLILGGGDDGGGQGVLARSFQARGQPKHIVL